MSRSAENRSLSGPDMLCVRYLWKQHLPAQHDLHSHWYMPGKFSDLFWHHMRSIHDVCVEPNMSASLNMSGSQYMQSDLLGTRDLSLGDYVPRDYNLRRIDLFGSVHM